MTRHNFADHAACRCERHGGVLHVSNFADGEIQCLVTNQRELILSGHASHLFVSLLLIEERAIGMLSPDVAD